MNKEKITYILNNLNELEPSGNLKFSILQRIQKAEQKKMFRRLMMLRLGMSVSAFSFALAIYYGGRELLVSDFWNIVMLGFSDFSLVLSNWQTFAWSLLETLPVAPLFMLSVPVLILMLLGRSYENNAHNNFKYLSA